MNGQDSNTRVGQDATKVGWRAVMDAIRILSQTASDGSDEAPEVTPARDDTIAKDIWAQLTQMEEPLNRVGAFLVTFEVVVQRGRDGDLSNTQCGALAYIAEGALDRFAELEGIWDSICGGLMEREAAQ